MAYRLPKTYLKHHKIIDSNIENLSSIYSKCSKNKKTIGFELELNHNKASNKAGTEKDKREFNTLTTKILNTLPSIFTCGKDYTAGNNNLELRSLPLTYASLKRKFNIINNYITFLRYNGFHSNENYGKTGLHIHFSKNHFNDNLHIIRFVYCYHLFINKIYKFSKRHHHYEVANYDKFRLFNPAMDIYQAGGFLNVNGFMSLGTLKLQFSNFNTIEIRVFKGIPSYRWVMTCAEFIICLINYTTSLDYNNYNWASFIDTTKKYKILNYYLKRIG